MNSNFSNQSSGAEKLSEPTFELNSGISIHLKNINVKTLQKCGSRVDAQGQWHPQWMVVCFDESIVFMLEQDKNRLMQALQSAGIVASN